MGGGVGERPGEFKNGSLVSGLGNCKKSWEVIWMVWKDLPHTTLHKNTNKAAVLPPIQLLLT